MSIIRYLRNKYSPWKDATSLTQLGQYERAIRAATQRMVSSPRHRHGELMNRSMAYLLMGDFTSAVQDNDEAERLVVKDGVLNTGYPERRSTILWLKGDRAAAMAVLREVQRQIRSGKYVVYSDMAGGGEVGLLYWYMCVRIKDRQSIENALDYLRWIVAKRPGSYDLLASIAAAVLSEPADRKSAWALASKEAATYGKLKNRIYCQLEFYYATQLLADGQADEAAAFFEKAYNRRNGFAFLEEEWHLSRAEVAIRS